MTDRNLLIDIGYDKELLATMTDEDCGHEVIGLQTGGHE